VVLVLTVAVVGCGAHATPTMVTPDAGGSRDAAPHDGSEESAPMPPSPDGAGSDDSPRPPDAPVGGAFVECGFVLPFPSLLGVDAAGEAVLFGALAFNRGQVELVSLPAGRIVRTIAVDGETAMLTVDGRRVLTRSTVVDLASGKTTPRSDPGGDFFFLDQAGVFEIGRDLTRTTATTTHLVVRGTTDGTVRDLCDVQGNIAAGTTTRDGASAFLLVYRGQQGSLDATVHVERRTLADGALEAELPLEGGAVIPGGAGDVPWPQLSVVGDFMLVHLQRAGFRLLRISDRTTVWSLDAGQALLSPVEGLVVSRASEDAPWTQTDVRTRGVVGTLPASDTPVSCSTLNVFDSDVQTGLAFMPDDSAAVLLRDGALWLGHGDGTRARLPFVRSSWGGRGLFAGPGAFVSIEATDSSFRVGLRMRLVPGGEIVGELLLDEAQSEWDGDLARSPDGHALAAALPDTVRIVRAADLAPLAVIPRAASRVAWAPDGATLLTTPDHHYRDERRTPPEIHRVVEVWTADGLPVRSYDVPFLPTFAAFTADGRGIVATGRDAAMATLGVVLPTIELSGSARSVLVDLATGQTSPLPMTVASVDGSRRFGTDLRSIERLDGGASVATLDLPKTPTVSGPDDLAAWLVADVDPRLRSFHPPVFSPDGSLVTGMAQPAGLELVLYAAATGQQVQTLPANGEGFASVDFSPDGRWLAASNWGYDGALRLWCRP
jgi:WD40 repeat protein